MCIEQFEKSRSMLARKFSATKMAINSTVASMVGDLPLKSRPSVCDERSAEMWALREIEWPLDPLASHGEFLE